MKLIKKIFFFRVQTGAGDTCRQKFGVVNEHAVTRTVCIIRGQRTFYKPQEYCISLFSAVRIISFMICLLTSPLRPSVIIHPSLSPLETAWFYLAQPETAPFS